MSNTVERDWTTSAGLRAACVRTSMGFRCGYVRLPDGHPLVGVGHSEQADCISQDAADSSVIGDKSPILLLTATFGSDGDGHVRRSPDVVIDVHGGLTFSGKRWFDESGGWWYGFDCAHYGDDDLPLSFVEAECERMAEQLAAIGPRGAES